MYNAITRAVEPELFKCLGNYGIRFHAYNPLAGGAFSKNFGASDSVTAGSRFDISHAQGKLYRERYWNDAYLDALAEIHRSCEGHGLNAVSVALRWLIHHSQLNAERNDGVIIGASSLEHLRHNLMAVTEGPLPTDVLTAIDDAASRPNRNGHPISMAFRFRSWSEVSHAPCAGTGLACLLASGNGSLARASPENNILPNTSAFTYAIWTVDCIAPRRM
jgi:aflatoxin B1 aldehyde reductase